MPRVGLDREAVVTAAAELADREGVEGLTLTRLAAILGVRTPSLYAHVGGLDDLRRAVAATGADGLAAALAEAATGRAGGDALHALARAYRSWALEHRGRYAELQRARDRDDESAGRLVGVVLAVLRGYGLEGDDAIHAARTVRAALHGFVSLEAEGGFGMPLDLDESFDRLVTALDRGLAAGSEPS
jgi:AcrR family transcriptional regulator